jgi:hypothetical protein
MVSCRCKDCAWFDREHESLNGAPKDFGYCRKHYPIVMSKDGLYYGRWPLVGELDLCGEFRKE